ncbi:MAG: DUF1194 domain-containing protein [Rhizobiaceae bacterium]
MLSGVVGLLFSFGGPSASHAVESVDVELVLAVDVSLSMSPDELEIQRDGYAAALTDQQVLDAIASGANGRIGVTYFEWAGNTSHHVIVPWTIIADRQDAERVAKQLSANPPNSARRTSISAALEFGGDLFAESHFRSPKRVIDISGDGPNNQGAPVTGIRDGLVRQGITINGLPLMTNGGLSSAYDVEDLDSYYTNCVIGGPGAFMVPVNAWEQFPEAIRRKLVLELASSEAPQRAADGSMGKLPVILAQAKPDYDCMIGEKLWRNRSWMWESR